MEPDVRQGMMLQHSDGTLEPITHQQLAAHIERSIVTLEALVEHMHAHRLFAYAQVPKVRLGESAEQKDGLAVAWSKLADLRIIARCVRLLGEFSE